VVLSILLLSTAAQAQSWPPDTVLNEAVEVQIPPEGLDAVTALIPSLIPTDALAIDDPALEEGVSGFNIKLSNVSIGLDVADATITPGHGVLDIHADLLVSINDPSDKFELYYEFFWIGTTCDGYLNPAPVAVDMEMALELVDGPDGKPVLDATMGPITVDYTDLTTYLELDCWIGDLEEILNYLGISLYEWIFGLVEGTLQDTLADLGPELETAIEDAFAAAVINEEIDLLDTTVELELYPSDLQVTPDGIGLIMAGGTAAEPAPCVEANDPGGSLRTDSPMPGQAAMPLGSHLGIHLSDDFTNQLLYTAYRGGVLCFDLQGDDPLPINTGLLTLIAGDVFTPLFPETEDMIIATRPLSAPEAVFDGEHHVGIVVDDLGLDFYGNVDDRMAKVVGMSLDVDAGIDLGFDGNTGKLEIEIDLSGDDVAAEVVHNELMTGTDEVIEENFAGAFDTIMDTVVGGLLEDLTFDLPSFEGVGLVAMDIEPAGANSDWLGLYAELGEVPYEAVGCDDAGGGCGGGCTTQTGQSRLFFLLLMPGLILLRRRR
jgi:hypothetical protein